MSDLAYIVITDDNIASYAVSPPIGVCLEIGKGRRTIKWRGRRFNVFAGRVVGIVGA